MLKRLIAFAFIILMFFTILPSNVEGLKSGDNGLLYIHSENSSAFITYDGELSASSLWIAFDLPEIEGQPWVSGDGWSPNGTWFAWSVARTFGNAGGDAVHGADIYLVDRGGNQQIIDIASDRQASFEWSPSAEILYVESRGQNITERFLFDPARQSTVSLAFGGNWVNDGSHLASIASGTLFITDLQGNTITKPLALRICGSQRAVQQFFSENHILFADDPNTLKIGNLNSDDEVTVPSPDAFIVFLDWHWASQTMFIYTTDDCSEQGNLKLWKLSMSNNSFELLFENVVLTRPSVNSFVRTSTEMQMSPTNQYAYVIVPSSTNTSSDFVSHEVYVVEDETIHQVPLPESANVLYIDWHSASLWILASEPQQYGIYRYNPSDRNLQSLQQIPYDSPQGYPYLTVSTDGRYLAYIAQHIGIYDLKENRRIASIEMNGNERIGPWDAQRLYLHPTEPALLIESGLPIIVGYYLVTFQDGEISQEELGRCINRPSCIGWMPSYRTLNRSSG